MLRVMVLLVSVFMKICLLFVRLHLPKLERNVKGGLAGRCLSEDLQGIPHWMCKQGDDMDTKHVHSVKESTSRMMVLLVSILMRICYGCYNEVRNWVCNQYGDDMLTEIVNNVRGIDVEGVEEDGLASECLNEDLLGICEVASTKIRENSTSRVVILPAM